MNKYLFIIQILAILAVSLFIWKSTDATTLLANNSCQIECHEKTPACYVTQDKSGCLDISNTAPKCTTKGSCTCVVKGCNQERTE